MNAFLLEYLPVLVFAGVAAFIGILFIALPLLLAPKSPDSEKLSAYECGFNAFDDARMKFDIRFYLVSILFHHLRPGSGLPVPVGGVDVSTCRTPAWCSPSGR